ncbi:integrase core domain-containing protein, partial [Rhodobacteraceae bacterium NNCM2]|nr:integrase core domain-containing protein [Coraliihabitans acroporae]
QRLIEAWRRDYNECRPHMAYNCRTPMEFAESSGMCHACSMKPPLDSNLSHGPPNPSVSADHALTINLDHSSGADQMI